MPAHPCVCPHASFLQPLDVHYWETVLNLTTNLASNLYYAVLTAALQAVRRRLLNAEARVLSQSSQCAIYGGQSGTGTGSLKVLLCGDLHAEFSNYYLIK
jgi:hypothetical protein